ncbi:MAG: saccharopine dehydrogenase NADP-binding domain-containing protein, partial [candidate division WOR-3 bacterium]
MELLIFGAGQMAQAVSFDLVRQPDVEKVYVVDRQPRPLNRLRRFLKSSRLVPVHAEATAPELKKLLARCQAAISCVPYNYNLRLTRMAIATG